MAIQTGRDEWETRCQHGHDAILSVQHRLRPRGKVHHTAELSLPAGRPPFIIHSAEESAFAQIVSRRRISVNVSFDGFWLRPGIPVDASNPVLLRMPPILSSRV